MDGKHLIGLVLLVMGCFGATVLACFSKRLRDLYFLMMIFFAPATELMNINFLSRDFYRGTTRGIEISCIDVLSVSLLVSMVLFPRRGEKRVFWPASFGL